MSYTEVSHEHLESMDNTHILLFHEEQKKAEEIEFNFIKTGLENKQTCFYTTNDPEKLKVGVHSLGYVAETREQAIKEFFPGYAESFTRIGRERGWPPVTMSHFESQIGPTGALVVGNVEEVAEKVIRHSEALGLSLIHI